MATRGESMFGEEPLHPGLTALRSQTAFVRSLVDELERMPSTLPPDEVSLQIVEELHRLAARCIDVARSLGMRAEDID